MCLADLPEQWWAVVVTWWSGRETTELTMCPLSMLWWGRIGKVLQFLAIVTVVLDIVGPERLHALAARFGQRDLSDRLANRLLGDRPLKGFLIVFGLAGLLSPWLVILVLSRTADDWPLGDGYGEPTTVESAATLGTVFLIMILPVIALALALRAAVPVAHGTIRLLALVIDRSGLRLRVAAIVVVLIGFHLDLLAS